MFSIFVFQTASTSAIIIAPVYWSDKLSWMKSEASAALDWFSLWILTIIGFNLISAMSSNSQYLFNFGLADLSWWQMSPLEQIHFIFSVSLHMFKKVLEI